jgi:glycosyltransferase involved in cell wall biosynthesis
VHVGLNLVYLVPGETGGMETYARELIPALMREKPDLAITAFVNREAAAVEGPWTDLGDCVRVPVKARRRVEWVLGEQLLLPRLAARRGVDVLHSLASTAPASGSFGRVVTIHDVIYRIYPEAHFGVRAAAMRALVPLAARRSDRVIAPSAATRDDLVKLLHVPVEKVDVVPEGVSQARVEPVDESQLRSRLKLNDRTVVLTASAKRPHKNLDRLLDAWALIPGERRPVLILPGYPTPHEQQLHEQALRLGLEADTRFLGWISAEELEGLYRLAACFVFPSLYEGFGLPVLEAMARGVPVACSARGSLAEVAGDAALLFDPESPRAIAAAIEEVLGNSATAERLRRAGLEQARCFSWETAARATLHTYELTLASRTRA